MIDFKQFLLESSYKDIKPEDIFDQWFYDTTMRSTIQEENFAYEFKQYEDMNYNDISDLPEFKEYMKEKFDELFDNFLYKIERIIIEKDNKIPIYRALTVNDKFFDHLKTTSSPKLGIYWSWDEGSAEAHWGQHNKPHTIVLHSEVNENEVNWKSTFLANLEPSIGEDEAEITLYDNTPLKILALVNQKTNQKYDISNIKDKTFRA